jgi:hypothetical protein
MFTFTRKTVLTLAAALAVGSMALVSTDASAKPGGFGGGMKFGGGGFKHGGGGFTHPGFKHPGFKHPGFKHPNFVHHQPHWKWHYGLRRHYWVAPVVATGIATRYVSQPTWNKCNCLTKEYTPEGAVVFKDLCTQEMAMNPPATTPAPAAYDPSQVPSIQGSMSMPQQMAMPAQQPAPLPGLQAR